MSLNTKESYAKIEFRNHNWDVLPDLNFCFCCFAFVQPGAIEGFAGYFLHGTCVLEQDKLATRQSKPARCMRGYRRWKVGSGH